MADQSLDALTEATDAATVDNIAVDVGGNLRRMSRLNFLGDVAAQWGGTAGGTANALTITPAPAISAYAAGQRFAFVTGASENSAAVTLAVSGLAAAPVVTTSGQALTGGELPPDTVMSATYDGASFRLERPVSKWLNAMEFGATGDGSTDDSAAIRATFDAWKDSLNGEGGVIIPPGKYAMAGPAFSDALIDYFADGSASGKRLTIWMQGAEFLPSYTPRGTRTAGLWDGLTAEIPLFEFGLPAKHFELSIIGEGFITGSRDVTTDPIGVLAVNLNKSTFNMLTFEDLANRALEIQSINNSRSYDCAFIDCGYQPTDESQTGYIAAGVTFDCSSGAVRVTASASGTFSASDEGKWFLMANSSGPIHVSKIATYVDDQNVDITDATTQAYTAATGSFSIVTGSMTAGDKTLTLNSPCVPAGYAGAWLSVYGAGYEDTSGSGGFNESEPRLLTSRITVRNSASSVELNHAARVSVSDVPIVFAPSVHIGYSDDTMPYGGHNNDFLIVGARLANSGDNRSFVPIVMQKTLRTEFVGCKFHVSAPNFENFAAGAFAVIGDNTKNTPFNSCMFTWGGTNPDYGQIALLGDRLGASFVQSEFFSREVNRFWVFSADVVDVDDSYIAVGIGFNNIQGWSETANRGYFKALGNATLEKTWQQAGGIFERASGAVRWYLSAATKGFDGTEVIGNTTYAAFTPTVEVGGSDITAGGGALATAEGRYVRQGRIVRLWLHVELSAKGTNTGFVDITLPAAISTIVGNSDHIGVGRYRNMSSLASQPWGRCAGAAEIRLMQDSGSGSNDANVTDANLTDTTEIYLSGWFETDA